MLSITQSHGYFLALCAGGISCIAFMFVIVCFDVHPGPSPHRLQVALKVDTAFMVYLTSHASVLLWRSLATVHYTIS